MRLVDGLVPEVPEAHVPRREDRRGGGSGAAVGPRGFPIEPISPIGAVNKGPVFGAPRSGTLLAIVIAELLVSRRLWCRALCPLGGTFHARGRGR